MATSPVKIFAALLLGAGVLAASGYGYVYYAGALSPRFRGLDDYRARVDAIPEFAERAEQTRTPEERLALALRLSRQGMHRLPDAAVVGVAQVKAKLLAAADSQACAGIARNTDLGAVLDAYPAELARLDTASANAWTLLAYRAALAELKQEPPRQPGEEEVTAAMAALIATLPAPQRDRFVNALSDKPGTSDADACWAGRTLYRKLVTMPEPTRGVLARAVLTDP
ncbi:MAG TPA: hypothetical protein VNA89_06230 [Gemmatimonadaceae bacterium]|nr:hypothetical protein [Gemmatimonadaceae bacterium]